MDNLRIERPGSGRPLRILLLEDCRLDEELIRASLTDGGIECDLVQVETRADFLTALETGAFNMILSDYSLPSFDGISALEIAQATCSEVPFIFVSGAIGEELAIETLKCGATDYVLKNRLERLLPSVRRALREAAERAALAALAAENARLYREAQEESRRKDEFLAMLAHELRNPLGAISAAVLLTRMHQSSDPSLQGAWDVIERQTDHMARLLDELLDISRVTRSKIELRKELLDVRQVVASAVEATRHHIEGREHQLSLALPSESLWVEVDPTRMEQVFTNLLNNAAKYTEPGGRIWISARRDGKEAVLRVSDTGVGLDPDMLRHIFELFMQVPQPLARTQGGLGIGLSMVRNLVEMHGGTVTANSPGVGRGSEFVVRLPLAGRFQGRPWNLQR